MKGKPELQRKRALFDTFSALGKSMVGKYHRASIITRASGVSLLLTIFERRLSTKRDTVGYNYESSPSSIQSILVERHTF